MPKTLSALALNGTLKTSAKGETSSTDRMITLLLDKLKAEGIEGETIRLADHSILPGVTSDEGAGDDWPDIRRRIMDADILIAGSPVWLGQPSSVIKRALERMDAFLSETDDRGHMPSYGKVAMVATVGNEDGAHHVSAELFQALNDVGFTLAPNAVSYWVGEAVGSTDFKNLASVPEVVTNAATMAARTAAHLARLLADQPYPSVK
ncbi:flavodoxin family protein [Pelagibacterium sp. H642]|uniref:flavodoxin family protein n=1 Tax=Pelagibacterium sp. H642 TaxID=1881069 RepID=UPI00281577AE|nr:flavodoxin family protein [Pelagibacterium sp. H642]WMT90234.1 flavodoxin family protein [Pelagibacterium sp. H642]